jgi:hypothetical protein
MNEFKYNIVRYFKSGSKRIIHKNVSLEVAQLHCNDKRTATDKYFDGYTRS